MIIFHQMCTILADRRKLTNAYIFFFFKKVYFVVVFADSRITENSLTMQHSLSYQTVAMSCKHTLRHLASITCTMISNCAGRRVTAQAGA